jgi:Putative TM nitroreductase
MELKTAMELRKSRRHYTADPIQEETAETLLALVKEINRETGLHLQMVFDHGEAFDGLRKSYGLFSGVQNYLVLAGKKTTPNLYEKMGYYGEKWVLLATSLGLGTCWVAGTYDKKSVYCHLEAEEEIAAVIPFGNYLDKETLFTKILRKQMHRNTKGIDELLYAVDQPPNWVIKAMKYVVKAPSAANRQPVKFTYSEGLVMATVPGDSLPQQFDLGIAKLHFELGTNGGVWQWGSGGIFELTE